MFKWVKILNLGYVGKFSANAFWFWSALILPILGLEVYFFASALISIIFLPCNCKHLTLLANNKEKLAKLKNWKITANSEAQVWWPLFHKNLISRAEKRSLEILFVIQNGIGTESPRTKSPKITADPFSNPMENQRIKGGGLRVFQGFCSAVFCPWS